ncbi:D-alanyl-D-alanine carboxypeptidase/D-alanyl-D-alanine endopeptidase [Oceanisphaera avium]|uniref:D-alanyl-D-alanine carboxypeptidase/D-alanyl-D-alanine-endopeptidase n=1 Tax=Oceanisphaera avium TaxID=1903694 RepID=A0A1Y0CU70_9GAMM|nr:D-alanyl-D-alanine carboxypeptidase/D-alanyl-D-alanine-endopeptidase [Oceanisphaera avium]ART78768.1 D-alanyl-D-alanine carboxypeptidase/D-alanyl-D-alanine-endopeptidase [Oceanisphaera avium]
MKLFWANITALLLGISPSLWAAPLAPSHSQAAWLVADANTGAIEAEHNADLLLKPASTQKLLTTLAGALALGPEWHYQTQLYYRGQLQNGQLNGDLLIDFVGDPSFSREQLRDLLAHSGVKKITGNLYLNQAHFSGYDRGNGWSWNDLSVCYTAPVSAMILDHNCVQGALYAHLGKPGRATVPAHQPITVSAQVKVLDSASQKRSFCSLDVAMSSPNQYHLSGCITPRKEPWPLRFAIQDVSAWGQDLSRWALAQAGMTLNGEIKDARLKLDDWQGLASHHSPPLSTLSQTILQDSDNLYTDSLMRTLGALHFKQAGSFANGTAAVREILLEEAHLDLGPSWLADGSGLSAHNLVRATDLLNALLIIAQDPRAQWLKPLLPVSGESGTLRYRKSVQDPSFKGKIQAKTGTIAHVQNLAGFIDTPSGTKAFVLLQNGLSLSPDAEQALSANQGEWPAKQFERAWLSALLQP